MITLWKEFIPLSISDVTMSIGDPMVNATMAQMPKLQTNLSALGVIKALVVLFESPIIMVLHASNQLSSQQEARLALKKFVILASAILTSFLMFLAIPTIFFPLLQLVGLTQTVALHAYKMFVCLLFWPGTIAFRRYYQGILIIHKQLKAVARAGLIRMLVLAFGLSIGFYFHLPTTYLAAGSMILGAFAETLVVYWGARKFCNLPSIQSNEAEQDSRYPKTVKEVWKFYWPLANSMVCVWTGRALLVVCLARAIDSSIALAAWPATWAIVVLFANLTRMIQQVIIRNQSSFHPFEFIIFATTIGLTLTVLILGLGVSSIGAQLLTYFVGNDSTLLSTVKAVLCICAGIPILVAIQNVLQGFLMCVGNTKAINRSTLYAIFTLLICAWAGVKGNLLGAQVAAYSMVVSLICENTLLAKQVPWKRYTIRYLQHEKLQEGIS